MTLKPTTASRTARRIGHHLRRRFTSLKSKILFRMLPKNRYLKWIWSNPLSAASWYDTCQHDPEHNLSQLEYSQYICTISDFAKSSKTVLIELGTGKFRLIEFLAEQNPYATFLGIDFSELSAKVYEDLRKRYPNVRYLQADITNTQQWSEYLQKEFNAHNYLIFTFGVLTYLTGEELSVMFEFLFAAPNIKEVTILEPTKGLNVHAIRSMQTGPVAFVHNYGQFLKNCGFKIIKDEYILGGAFIFIHAKK